MPGVGSASGVEPPGLVASDLDGTLVRSDGSISADTVAVWNALPRSGIESVLVTARPPRWLHDLADMVGPRGVALCGNGAFVYDVTSRRLLASTSFEVAILTDLLSALRHAIPGVAFAAERGDGPLFEEGFLDPHREAADVGPTLGRLEESGLGGVGKLLALAPSLPTAQFFASAEQVIGDRGQLAYSGAPGLLEVNPAGLTKAAALAAWCAGLGMPASRVWAFGDMPNDLDMLAWAGRGYAVANAHPEVIRVASHICPSNDEDGVATTLAPFVAA